ncbi:toll-like receptor 21 [Osmerus eperlanus]|uniref:toll-like receptor 21 n=1 Tax=Osmerus eperlanus TaxID=29151 RepID=UPI002E13C34D
MKRSTSQMIALVGVVLSLVQFTLSYSYRNCIEDPNSSYQNFSCTRRGARNIFKDIVVDLPPSATTLTISFNKFKDIPDNTFAHLPDLTTLRINFNHQLRTIGKQAFHNLDHLKSLNLSCNNLSLLNSLVFKNLSSLTFLSLSNNTLKGLQKNLFSPVTNLDTLILRQNLLSNFSEVAESVTPLQKLKKLDLCCNKLTSIRHSTVTSLPKSLTALYLCRNQLYTLSCAKTFLGNINLLDLSYNEHLPSTAFKNVDLRHINYLRLRSTNVTILYLFKVSNVRATQIDFSGMGLSNNSQLEEFCKLLRSKVKHVKKMMLGNNGIRTLWENTLSSCPPITVTLDLSRNFLRNISCLQFLKGQDQIQSFSVEHNHLTTLVSCIQMLPSLKNMTEISYRYNRILKVDDFAFDQTPNIKTLELNINTIAYLGRKALKGLKNLKTLRLDNNLLTDLFNDTFEDLLSLQTLNLRNNRIAVIFYRTFFSLTNLTTLDLGGNKISHFEKSALEGLKSLKKLYLDGNHLNQIDSTQFRVFQDTLQVLDLQRNQIRYLSEYVRSPFVNLTKLRDLKLDSQMPYGINLLPHAFFRGLSSLTSLYLTNNHITNFATDAFDDLTGLNFLTLDNSCAGVVQLQPGVFKNLRNLRKLIAENMGIQNFSKEVFGNLTSLQILQLNHNVMQTLDVEVLEALPKLRYLDIRNIPFSCTCPNNNLQNWTVHNKQVQLVYLYNLTCPGETNIHFVNFDTKVCFIDLGQYLFISTYIVIILTMLIPVLYTKLYWKMKYSYYVFRSWFSESWRRLREEEEVYEYDAFISYNSADESWVLEHLLPNLEGNGSNFKLCLHHRDFELGRYIVDNIVSAVYGSRKTICVVSKDFLRSEWCSLEIQLASYRLFHDLRDVLLLVFLEPIPERQLSAYHRMRKVMLKKTYLQWPEPDCSDPVQAQELFWNQLRRALSTGSSRVEELGEKGREDKDATKHSENYEENETMDDKRHHLLA